MTAIIYTLIFAGIFIHILSLFPATEIVAKLPESSARRLWHILRIFILMFILGYLSYILDCFLTSRPPLLNISVIFFAGALFVLLVCQLARLTIIDIQRIARLEKENITDVLTGLFNRRHLENNLSEEYERARRYGVPLSVIMIDVDHFKHINDQYGHDAGDNVLRELGRVIRENIRNSDTPARYGGEEIVITLPLIAEHNAFKFGERLRKMIEQEKIQVDDNTISCTVSIGVAECGDDIDDFSTLLRQADRALYEAKKSGRNRVIAASELKQ